MFWQDLEPGDVVIPRSGALYCLVFLSDAPNAEGDRIDTLWLNLYDEMLISDWIVVNQPMDDDWQVIRAR